MAHTSRFGDARLRFFRHLEAVLGDMSDQSFGIMAMEFP
jgi:hypothetical protein